MNNISQIEEQHLFRLYSDVKNLFNGQHLPSHDENHHLRVWLHCRGLFTELTRVGVSITYQLIENALIACMFHDSGMVDEIGEKHGALGVKYCKQYLQSIGFADEQRTQQICNAIELHDQKNNQRGGFQSFDDMLNLDRLVATADDLDSIGYIGVFRYIEIYLKRGIAKDKMPVKASTNLRRRITNFLTGYSSFSNYCEKQTQRAAVTMNFFMSLSLLIAQDVKMEGTSLEVYNIFSQMIVDEGQSLEQVIDFVLKNVTSSYTLQFFSRLQKELNVVSAIMPHA